MKYWGGYKQLCPPKSNFGGDRPPLSPPKSTPLNTALSGSKPSSSVSSFTPSLQVFLPTHLTSATTTTCLQAPTWNGMPTSISYVQKLLPDCTFSKLWGEHARTRETWSASTRPSYVQFWNMRALCGIPVWRRSSLTSWNPNRFELYK